MTTFQATEQTSARYLGTLTDETGTLVGPTILDSAALTLYDERTNAIINSRDAQDVLNANGVTIYNTLQTASDGTTYNLVWLMDPADNMIVTSRLPFEAHIAVFDVRWSSTKRMVHEVRIRVENVGQIS